MVPKKATVQYSLLVVLLIWSALAQTTISGYVIYSLAASNNTARLPFSVFGDSLEIQAASPRAKALGFEPGDELVSLNGRAITGYTVLQSIQTHLRPGETLHVTVRRQSPGNSPRLTELAISLKRLERGGIDWVLGIVFQAILPVISLSLGFFVAFSRPRDPLAWITLAMLASLGQGSPGNYFALPSFWREIVVFYRSLLGNTWPLWVMLFGLYFPEPFHFLKRRTWIGFVLAVPFIALVGLHLYTDHYVGEHIQHVRSLAYYERIYNAPVTVFYMLCISSFFVSLGVKWGMARNPDAKRRLQWLLAGSMVAFTPIFIAQILNFAFQIQLPLWYFFTALLLIVLFPLTLAYVIVVQRAMEVRVAMRMGLQYTFARGGIAVVRILLSTLAIFLGVSLSAHFGNAVVSVILIGISITFVVLIRKLGTKVLRWLDRRFFREVYNTEVILTALSQSVAGIRDTRTLLETVSRQISESLHVPRVAVLLDSFNMFRPAYALGYATVPSVELKHEADTVRVLKQSKQPSLVYLDDEKSWVQRTTDEEREILRLLDTQLLLPLSLKEELLGVISLGPKLSQEPYSTADLRLLHAVASQTGLALENARLTESIKEQIAQTERMNRELEIAREVQQRLFPQDVPIVQGLEIAGYCRQQDVGGDYYDFVHLSDGCLGIAVGDVAGKGIAAALMMATLQASLRGQTIRRAGTLAEMIRLINQLGYEASATNRYATFFYAQYHPPTRLLRYVNAGHNPPIICRPGESGNEILRLEEGGTVLGSVPHYPYQESSVQLRTGDVLVAFTDGISEAMNEKQEEWDEARLIDCISRSRSRSAPEIIAHILEEVDRFTAGTMQHDDMTLVVVCVQ